MHSPGEVREVSHYRAKARHGANYGYERLIYIYHNFLLHPSASGIIICVSVCTYIHKKLKVFVQRGDKTLKLRRFKSHALQS